MICKRLASTVEKDVELFRSPKDQVAIFDEVELGFGVHLIEALKAEHCLLGNES